MDKQVGEAKQMDPLPAWLSAAIDAAGVCIVYNADDWKSITATGLMPLANEDSQELPPLH